MLFKSAIADQASGSLGGLTASRNRFGSYFRTRALPVNPATPAQTTVRATFAQLAGLWQDTLTQAQRDAWTLYGDNVPVINRIGAVIFLTGLNQYIRSNTARLQGTLARVDDAPIIFDLGTFTPITAAFDAAFNGVDITFDNTDAWANEGGATMLVRKSRQYAPTINFFKGPFQFAGEILGDLALPPTSPANITGPFNYDVANKATVAVRVSQADGRLSTEQLVAGVIA